MKKIIIVLFFIASFLTNLNAAIIYSTSQTVTSRSFNDDVYIKSGVTVIFRGNFNVSPNKTIYVEDNALLFIENSTLTSNDGKWNGIRLKGNLSCGYAFNSYLSVIKSTITNAKIAIMNIYDADINGTDGGGVVYSKESIYDNNCANIYIYRIQFSRCILPFGIFDNTFNDDDIVCDGISSYSILLSSSGYDVAGNTFNMSYEWTYPGGTSPVSNLKEIRLINSFSTIKNNTFNNKSLCIRSSTSVSQVRSNSIFYNNINNSTIRGIEITADAAAEVSYNYFNDLTDGYDASGCLLVPKPTSTGGTELAISGIYAGRNLKNTFKSSYKTSHVAIFLDNIGSGFNTVDNAKFIGYKKLYFNYMNLQHQGIINLKGNTRSIIGGIKTGLKIECCDFKNVEHGACIRSRVNSSFRENFNSTIQLNGVPTIIPSGNTFSLNYPSLYKFDNNGNPNVNYYYNDNVVAEQLPDNNRTVSLFRIYENINCMNSQLKMASSSTKVEFIPKSEVYDRIISKFPPCMRSALIPIDRVLTVSSKVSILDHITWIKVNTINVKNDIIAIKNQIPIQPEILQEKETILSSLAEEQYNALSLTHIAANHHHFLVNRGLDFF
jgi:hypothetical protein